MPESRPVILLTALAATLAGWALYWSAISLVADAGAGRPANNAPPPVLAAPHPACVDDVSVSAVYLADLNSASYLLADPPDYAADGDHEIRIDYEIDNYSCQDVTIVTELRGVKSGARINNADPADTDNFDTCSSSTGCQIEAGDYRSGSALWDLSQHPATSGETVAVSFTVSAPAGFTDADSSNNRLVSTDVINILAAAPPTPTPTPTPAPVTDIALTGLTLPAATPIAGARVSIGATIANQGNRAADEIALNLYVAGAEASSATTAVASIAVGETVTATLDWNTAGRAPGDYALRVVASVADDDNLDDNARAATIALRKPALDVGFTGEIPATDVAVIGEKVTLSAQIANRGEIAVAVPVKLYIDEAAVPATTATTGAIAAGGTETVAIDWDTAPYANLPDEYRLRLAAELPGDASAGDDTLEHTVQLFHSAFDDEKTKDDCADDVRINVPYIVGLSNWLRNPPTYNTSEDNTVSIGYDVYNYSCDTDITVSVALSGTASGKIVITDDPCIEGADGCVIPAGGLLAPVLWWQLSSHTPAAGEKVRAVATVVKPEDFSDTDPDNNTHTSQDFINIIYPNDIVLDIGTASTVKGKLYDALAPFNFVSVAVELSSAGIAPSLPFEAAHVSIPVRIINRGVHREYASVVISRAEDGCRTDETPLLRRDLYVDPMQSKDITLSLPTDNLSVGRHRISISICAVNNAAQKRQITLNFTRRPPALNAEIVSIAASPARSVMRGLPVSVRVVMRNNGSRGAYLPIQLRFPSDGKQPERRSPWVRPGAISTVTFTWRTGDYAVGEHTLRATLLADDNITDGDTSAILSYQITPLRLDAAIGAISIDPAAPVAGEPVTITVPARNNGPIGAHLPVTLRYPSDHKSPETRRPYIALGATETSTFTWRTGDYPPGTYTFQVKAGATASKSFTIELLPPVTDFTVAELHPLNPEQPIVKGDWTTVAATVANIGPYADRAVVTLRNLTAGRDIDTRNIELAVNASTIINFAWNTRHYAAGEHSLQVVATSQYDTDAGNNASDTIPVVILTDRDITLGFGGQAPESLAAATMTKPRVDTAPHIIRYTIAGILTSPNKPAVSDPVNITVKIRNDGTHTANVPVTLHFPSDDKQPETRRPRIAPGQTGTATFTWRTSRYRYGKHTFQVEVPTINPRSFTVTLHPPTVDFTVAELYPPSLSYPIVKGDWVEVAAFVRNLGSYAGRAQVTLRDLTRRRAMYSQSVVLPPGGARIVVFTWKTLRYAVGEHRLQASVAAAHDINPDNDRSETAAVTILTNRDITVGFGNEDGNGIPAGIAAAALAPPNITVPAQYPPAITEPDAGSVDAATPMKTPHPGPGFDATQPPAGAAPSPASASLDDALRCAELQRQIGHSQPRAVLCPNAPPLIY